MKPRAFTIVELLVVIGILAILMGILLPTLFRARGMAMRVVCSARLRDLTMAATLYHGAHRVYPDPMEQATVSATGGATVRPSPHRISAQLLNQLRETLNFPEVKPLTPASALPPFVQCPFIEVDAVARGPFAAPAPLTPTYYTGYAYLGRLSEVSVAAVPVTPPPTSPTSPTGITILPGLPVLPSLPTLVPLTRLPLLGGLVPQLEMGVELKPGRAAVGRSGKRAVLWADNVYQSEDADRPWQYTHTRRATRGHVEVSHADASELLGQHRAFSDGSVEWVEANTDDLKLEVTPKSNTAHASFKTFLGELWWF